MESIWSSGNNSKFPVMMEEKVMFTVNEKDLNSL
jgi:hypothetical protein